MRRTERALVDEYRTLMTRSLGHLTPASAAVITAIAASAEEIRGYEDVKRRSIDGFRSHTAKLVSDLIRLEEPDCSTPDVAERYRAEGSASATG